MQQIAPVDPGSPQVAGLYRAVAPGIFFLERLNIVSPDDEYDDIEMLGNAGSMLSCRRLPAGPAQPASDSTLYCPNIPLGYKKRP